MSDEEKKAIEYYEGGEYSFSTDMNKEEFLKALGIEDKEDSFDNHTIRFKTLINLIEKQQKEIEHQIEKRNNQKTELAILNEKQKEFNKLTNTVKSYKGMFKRQQKEIERLKEYEHMYKDLCK